MRRRRFSLGAKLAAFSSCALVLVSVTLFVQLAAREREKLVAAKQTAASMVTQLLAIELGPALDFGDDEDVAIQLGHLHRNRDIVAASVWARGSQVPTAAWDGASEAPAAARSKPDGASEALAAPPLQPPAPDEPDGTSVSPDWLITTQSVANRAGARIARLRVAFTLRPENEAFRAGRLRLLWMTAALTLATAGLLTLFARRYVLGPLERLAEGAVALANGDLSARVELRSNDEIGDLARAFNVMSEAVAFRQERLKREVDLAHHIQSAILPRSLEVPGLELVAMMEAATEVGGDYYDVVPVEEGCWIGIGDVAGHGLDTGLIMLMTQAIVSALVRREPRAAPRDVVCMLNEVLFDNIRNRLEREDHVTLTLLHYDRSGRVVFAGAHEDIVVYRADQGGCEIVETPGTWLGGRRDIQHATVDTRLQLRKGDLLVLYTDGVTEMRNAAGEEFGLDRLCAELARLHALPIESIRSRLRETLVAWGTPKDDVTVLVARYEGREVDAG